MSLAIEIETPLQEDVRVLVAELNATLMELTPPEFCHHLTVEQMADDTTMVFVARDDGQAVACGALKCHAGGIGELKRMYTRPSHRGHKIGAQIVERIEALARDKGLKRLVLETGDRHPAAWTVYERAASRAAARCSIIPTSPGRCFMRRRWRAEGPLRIYSPDTGAS